MCELDKILYLATELEVCSNLERRQEIIKEIKTLATIKKQQFKQELETK